MDEKQFLRMVTREEIVDSEMIVLTPETDAGPASSSADKSTHR